MKIPPVGVELFHADRRTDMTKLIFAFCNFTKATKNTRIIRDKGEFTMLLRVCVRACVRVYVRAREYVCVRNNQNIKLHELC